MTTLFKRLAVLLALVWPLALHAEPIDANAHADALFDTLYEEQISLSPMWQTYLGRKTRYGEWDDLSPGHRDLYHRLYQDQLRRLESLDAQALSQVNQLNLTLFKKQLKSNIAAYRWRWHGYPVNQMFGMHTQVSSLLMNAHRVDNADDARAYIERLNGVAPLFDQLIDNLFRRARLGIVAPAFVYPDTIRDCRNLVAGAPFEPGAEPSPLWADFTGKLQALELDTDTRRQLMSEARKALVEQLEPAYRELIDALQRLEKLADDRAGVWKLPDGDAYYRHRLVETTTTDMTPEAIHQLGLDEVDRLRGEMRELIKRIGFDGSLDDFFTDVRENERFYYPDTDAGRAQYLEDTRAIIDAMRERLPDLFGRLPEADLTVKAVEPYREASAGKAFYQSPAPDGSRPGIYYVNLHDLAAMPRYQMEALAYHEALPGHHMQIAIAQQLPGVPAFRRHAHYTAYTEGWGLYAERVPKEMGFYADPYADFGRLSMELWRAVRLVVDTGLHHKRWSREKAIDYFSAHTPMTRADATREVERYIVMPGQATAYKIGMNHILTLRERARRALGERFDLAAFHDRILGGGALPLDVLTDRVERWIDERQSAGKDSGTDL